MADELRAIFDSTYGTSEERAAYLLDGETPPPPSPVAGGTFSQPLTAPAAVASTTLVASKEETTAEGPGFWSRFGSAAKDLVGTVADNLRNAQIPAARPRQPVVAAPPPAPDMPWLPWAIGAGALLLLLALLKRD